MAKGNALYRPGSDGVYFLPLGGSGEIGMNLSLYGTDGKWLMVDLGVSFADDSLPGIDVIMPDPTFIAERKNDLVGIVLTHGHEDHLGAIEYLWPYLQCPVYATPFTAGLLRAKLSEREYEGRGVRIIEVPLSGKIKLGPFDVEWISITHSIPEACCLSIKTKHGTVLHTGDWKLDPAPMLGDVTDTKALKVLGDSGVMAAVVDSTNALVPGHSGSEAEVRDQLKRVFGLYQNRIVVTCFASNVARLMSIYEAAKAHDREVALVGRSLARIEEVARDTGYITPDVMFLEPHEGGFLPRDKAVYIVTGSQGEKRSALARLANGEHRDLMLESGDTVLFSSREIPGNEKAISAVQNALIKNGIQVVTVNEEPIHVSGHPCQDELVQMYQWLRPKVAVPVHGEARHQTENARIAAQCQVPHSFRPQNGEMYRLGPGAPEKVAEVQAGKWVLDGLKLRPLDDDAIKARQKMMGSGVATVSLVLDERGQLIADPQVSLIGFGDDEGDEIDHLGSIRQEIGELFEHMPKSQRVDDVAIQHAVRLAVRKLINEVFGRKPLTEIHITRI